MPSLVPVVLSGGEGTRLWPLSTPATPKQFGEVIPGDSLFALCLSRFVHRSEFGRPVVVTSRRHLDLVHAAAGQASVELGLTISEPVGRNTAPAAIAAALTMEPDDTLVIVPSDHLIRETDVFVDAVLDAASLASDSYLVTFGVVPTRADTGYGYIEPGSRVGPGFEVRRFTEKPDETDARRMVESGFLWNAGIFVVQAGTLISEAGTHCPAILEGVKGAISDPVDGEVSLGDGFSDIEPVSIDVAIAEKTERAAVLPMDVGWSDIGSYESLWSAMDHDEHGNAVSGPAVLVDVHRSLVRSSGRTLAVAGIDDVVVIETDDAVLVTRRDRSQMVREVAERLGRNTDPDS